MTAFLSHKNSIFKSLCEDEGEDKSMSFPVIYITVSAVIEKRVVA